MLTTRPVTERPSEILRRGANRIQVTHRVGYLMPVQGGQVDYYNGITGRKPGEPHLRAGWCGCALGAMAAGLTPDNEDLHMIFNGSVYHDIAQQLSQHTDMTHEAARKLVIEIERRFEGFDYHGPADVDTVIAWLEDQGL